MVFRVGTGYDSHRFVEGRPLVLGGVTIPGTRGLLGHSDADALIHAICDAIFGAMASGDIGGHFPDSDARWRAADSAHFLEAAVEELATAGFRLSNVDATVITEAPRLTPYIPAIRTRLAELMNVSVDAVSVKGKSNEGMDAIGHREGIAVHAVALIFKE